MVGGGGKGEKKKRIGKQYTAPTKGVHNWQRGK